MFSANSILPSKKQATMQFMQLIMYNYTYLYFYSRLFTSCILQINLFCCRYVAKFLEV